MARRLDRIAPPGPVLDVGSGDGTLVEALRRRGREAVGLERANNPAEDLGVDASSWPAERWAAVVFWHSLEHLPDPGAALERARDAITPQGVLIVSVPNAASIQARLFGDRWFGLDIPRHLVHLPSETLLDRMWTLGLRVERVSYLRGGQVAFGWLHGLVGTLPGRPSLYDAIRRSEARMDPITGPARLGTLVAAVLLLPLALFAAAAEVLARRGGTVYVEARAG